MGIGGKRTDFGWLGSGIYFGTQPESVVKFTSEGTKGTRMMLVATVALGSVKEYSQITPTLERTPIGFHSALGKPGPGSDFPTEEYVVYKPEQQKLEFLVEFRLLNKSLAKVRNHLSHDTVNFLPRNPSHWPLLHNQSLNPHLLLQLPSLNLSLTSNHITLPFTQGLHN